jgi:hypothetical protein
MQIASNALALVMRNVEGGNGNVRNQGGDRVKPLEM